MTLRWTKKARREFDGAFDYLFAANPSAALSWRSDVAGMMQMLENHPRIGRFHRRDLDGDFREVLVGRYRVPTGSPAFVPV